MNISSINNGLPNIIPRSVATETLAPESRQTLASQNNGTIEDQPRRSIAQTQKTNTDREELENAVKQVNDFLKPINNSIQFNVDDDTGKTIVKVIDLATKDVIRQFPSEEMLAIASAIDKMKGLLIQQKA